MHPKIYHCDMARTLEDILESQRRGQKAFRERKRIAAGRSPEPMTRHEVAKIARAAQLARKQEAQTAENQASA